MFPKTCLRLRRPLASLIFLFLHFHTKFIKVAAEIYSEQENDSEPRQMSREAHQRMFLDVLYGKAFGPSADNTVSVKYELDSQVVASINTAVPFGNVFQLRRLSDLIAATDAMYLLTNNTKSTYVVLVRAARLRRLINYDVWTRAFFESTLYSPALENLGKPSLLEVSPFRALPRPVIDAAIAQADKAVKQCPVVNEKYGEANGIQNRLWYFRENFELNIEHWFWHLTYPLRMDPNGRPDRRGELFYYLHQSLLARYNAERLANGFPLTTPVQVSNRSVLDVAYYPYLTDMYTGKYWPSRKAKQLVDFNGDEGENIPAFMQTVYAAIDAKELISEDGEVISLDNMKGIDFLVDVIEANAYSVNLAKYGNIHNDGHILIAELGNTTYDFYGVMAELSTSIRDPAFFKWHTFIQNIFLRHKLLLTPYSLHGGDFPLIWNGVVVMHLEVDEGLLTSKSNQLHTFWAHRKFDISTYINSIQNRPGAKMRQMPACLKHLQHKEFKYHIKILSASISFKKATIRIFMAPRYDVSGKNRFNFEEQRQLFFALDTFTINLSPGINFITRKSKDTTFNRPFSKSFAQLEREIQRGHVQKPQCGCGLPHHLLLPKGKEDGMVFDLFVMVTNGEDSDGILGDQSTNVCTQPYHWCGRPGQEYPDKRPMGYPFDRIGPKGIFGRRVNTLEEYVGLIPNSKAIQVTITHTSQDLSTYNDEAFSVTP